MAKLFGKLLGIFILASFIFTSEVFAQRHSDRGDRPRQGIHSKLLSKTTARNRVGRKKNVLAKRTYTRNLVKRARRVNLQKRKFAGKRTRSTEKKSARRTSQRKVLKVARYNELRKKRAPVRQPRRDARNSQKRLPLRKTLISPRKGNVRRHTVGKRVATPIARKNIRRDSHRRPRFVAKRALPKAKIAPIKVNARAVSSKKIKVMELPEGLQNRFKIYCNLKGWSFNPNGKGTIRKYQKALIYLQEQFDAVHQKVQEEEKKHPPKLKRPTKKGEKPWSKLTQRLAKLKRKRSVLYSFKRELSDFLKSQGVQN